jgi:repressor LexA
MQPRTRRQKEVLEYIKQYIESHDYEPSYQQIARHFGVSSKAGIAKHIEALENQGLLSRTRESGSFKIEINATKSVLDSIRQVSWFDSPDDFEKIEDWEGTPLFVPAFMVDGHLAEKVKAFRVQDESMKDAHICEGDVVLIEERRYPRDGEIVLAVLEKTSALLSTYFRAGSNIELRPANSSFEPISLGADQIEIIGVLRGILRPSL